MPLTMLSFQLLLYYAISLLLSQPINIPAVQAQVSAPDCLLSEWDWTFNSLGQGPCLVAAYIEAVCRNGEYTLPVADDIQVGGRYQAADFGSGDNYTCSCDPVFYSLISACEACRGIEWLSLDDYYGTACTARYPTSFLPNPIPDDTRVPHWAYLNITDGGTWDNVSSFASIDSPDSRAAGDTFSPTSTSSSTSISSMHSTAVSATLTSAQSPSPSSSSSASNSGSSSGHTSSTGAIAGGVVGGVLGACVLGGFFIFIARRQQRSRRLDTSNTMDLGIEPYPNSSVVATTAGSQTLRGDQWKVGTSEMGELQRRYYDPMDPTTYPPSISQINATTTNEAHP